MPEIYERVRIEASPPDAQAFIAALKPHVHQYLDPNGIIESQTHDVYVLLSKMSHSVLLQVQALLKPELSGDCKIRYFQNNQRPTILFEVSKAAPTTAPEANEDDIGNWLTEEKKPKKPEAA